MIEGLSQTQGKLYPRAVDPAQEGQMRARNTREVSATAQELSRNSQSRANSQHVAQFEQASRGPAPSEQRAHEIAEQLSQSLRQAKQSSAKHKSSFSLTSTTGRRANQSYLAPQSRELRLVDELA